MKKHDFISMESLIPGNDRAKKIVCKDRRIRGFYESGWSHRLKAGAIPGRDGLAGAALIWRNNDGHPATFPCKRIGFAASPFAECFVSCDRQDH